MRVTLAIGQTSLVSLSVWRARWRVIRALLERDLRALVVGMGGYIALTLGLLAALLVVRNLVDVLARDRLLILSDAFTLPFFVGALVLILFLALSAATSIAREKEQGTLEVLFYGPVDAPAYLLGKLLAQVASYLVFGLGLVALLAVFAALSGLRLGSAFPFVALLSVPTAAAVTAAGLWCSALARGVRAAVALLLAISCLLIVLWLGTTLLSGLAITGAAHPMLWLRDVAIGLDQVVGFLSPIATFERGIDAAVRGSWSAYGSAIVSLLGQCLMLLVGAIITLQWRGVRR